MNTKKTIWFSAFRNVVPSDYEKWLEDLALQGWQADKIGQWSSVHMTLTRGNPKRYRFVYDMQVSPREEYRQTYEQFGWEYVGQMASAFIWRKEYSQERPESFSDNDSLKRRNLHVLAAASVSFFIFSLTAVIATVFFVLYFKDLVPIDFFQFILGMALSYAIALYLGYVLIKINKNIRK